MATESMSAESMFAKSMLESGNIRPQGRGWATAVSTTIQSLLVAVLVALPIFRPDALPLAVKSISSPVAYGRTDLPRPETTSPSRPAPTETKLTFVPADPSRVPAIDRGGSEAEPGPYWPGPGQLGRPDGVPHIIDVFVPRNPPVVAVKPPERPVISQMELGTLISRVQPNYPPLAVQTGTQGTVLLRAVIDRQGRITHVQVLSGHPLLTNAARNAVERWRYRPYILNGQAVEVETQITVNFKLAR